ncbi:hypothetical protein PENSPDRAFT_687821 [Peniophora sp. CONT]|nr:hypothetical protein PENSPDRAFT_687821 [Peniophora sp. CONT]
MGQYFILVNLTHREAEASGFFPSKFSGYVSADDENFGIEQNLAVARFPSEIPQAMAFIEEPPHSHLGRLSAFPSELIDAVFERLDVPLHVAHFAAAHPLLVPHGFARLLQIRTRTFRHITWSRSRIALVGDYLDRPDSVKGLLSDNMRAQMRKVEERIASEEGRERRLSLYEYASDYFKGVRHNSLGPWDALQRKEENALGTSDVRSGPAPVTGGTAHIDQGRIDGLLHHVRAILPSLDTAVLCNSTKNELVRAETLCAVKMDDRTQLSLGTAVLFLTVCTDDWSILPWCRSFPDPGKGDVIGRWAGDTLVIVGLDEAPENMKDISEEVVAMVQRFVEMEKRGYYQ